MQMYLGNIFKVPKETRCQWLMPIILAIQVAERERSGVLIQGQQKV